MTTQHGLGLGMLAAATLLGSVAMAQAPSPQPAHRARDHARPARKEPETRLHAGRFGTVTVYIPEDTPRSVAIFAFTTTDSPSISTRPPWLAAS